jgi:hypothetical protein
MLPMLRRTPQCIFSAEKREGRTTRGKPRDYFWPGLVFYHIVFCHIVAALGGVRNICRHRNNGR